MFALSLIPAGLGEEMSWRGFALPHLVKNTRPLTAALIIGGVWACWHLALYFYPGFIQYAVAQTYGFVVTFVKCHIRIKGHLDPIFQDWFEG